MPLLRATSIKRKLTLLVMLTTTVALLVAAVQFILNDVRDYRRRVAGDLSILARIIGENCTSALEFDYPTPAEQTLAALQAKTNIIAAAVYSTNGNLFASYRARQLPAQILPARAPPIGHHFQDRRLTLCQPISKNDITVGSIYIDFDLIEVWRRVAQNCGV